MSAPDFKAKLREVPHQPGVYLMKDRLGSIIYVGKARDLKRRVSSYFLASQKTRSNVKTRALIDSIHDFEFHTVRNEEESLLLEGKLIKDYRPRYNVAFRDDKRFLLAKIRLADPWPRFQTTRMKKDDGSRYFGPFPSAGAVRESLAILQKLFRLRQCDDDDRIDRAFNAVCKRVWGYTLDDFDDESLSPKDHAFLDALDEARARIFAAERGYDLVDDEGMLTDWWGYCWMILAEKRGLLTPENRAAARAQIEEKYLLAPNVIGVIVGR